MEKKGITYLTVIGIIVAFFIGWGVTAIFTPTGSQRVSIIITGSTTCEPVITTSAEEFMLLNPNVDISVTGTGSGSGISDSINGLNDIGMSSRNIKSTENASTTPANNLIDYKFAKDGIAVIIDADNPNAAWLESNGLTMDQVFLIYNGNYTTWHDIDGSLTTDTIDCFSRAEGSGTRATFEELITYDGEQLGEDSGYELAVTGYTSVSSNSLMVQGVADNDYGFGYCGLGYVTPDVIAVPVNGVAPSVATVLDNTYPVSRSLHLITNGPVSGWVQAFLDYIFGPYGQKIVADEGFIRIWF